MANLFERLNKGRPPPAQVEEKDQKRRDEEALLVPAQKLLDWLQRWEKDTVNLRDIGQRGPKSIRDRKSAIQAAQILVHHGWLVPKKMRRYNARVWKIARKPIVAPTVAAE